MWSRSLGVGNALFRIRLSKFESTTLTVQEHCVALATGAVDLFTCALAAIINIATAARSQQSTPVYSLLQAQASLAFGLDNPAEAAQQVIDAIHLW